jgi:LPS export ABC transporter protein LptC
MGAALRACQTKTLSRSIMQTFSRRNIRLFIIIFIVTVLIFALGWFVFFRPTITSLNKTPQTAGASLQNITLTEFDAQGKLLWEITSTNANYRQDSKIADVEDVKGKFYRSGEPLMEATGDKGTINQITKEIALEGNIKAIAIQEKIDMKADLMVWQSKEDVLKATGNIQIHKPDDNLTMTGKELTAKPSTNVYSLEKEVVVTSVKPPLEMKSDKVTWDAKRDRVFTEVPLSVLQVKDKLQLSANKGDWNIAKKEVTFTGDIKAKDPKLDVDLEAAQAVWNLDKKLVTLPVEFTATSKSRGIVVTAQQGQAQLQEEKINLTGQVSASFRSTQGTVKSDSVEWLIPSKTITANGNIIYQQPDKNLNVTGDRAVANLDLQTVTVTGTNVISTLTP